MSRAQWILLAVLGPPAVVASALVSATFGPIGAVVWAVLLLFGVNTRHLFHHHRPKGPRR